MGRCCRTALGPGIAQTAAVHDLERALTLYKGDFLDGFYISESQGFEEWQLVEGLPLAIELAASWEHRMPCERIASHIQRDLDFLSTNLRDVPEQHRSTRALFEHS